MERSKQICLRNTQISIKNYGCNYIVHHTEYFHFQVAAYLFHKFIYVILLYLGSNGKFDSVFYLSLYLVDVK